jgi:hypothetical protein
MLYCNYNNNLILILNTDSTNNLLKFLEGKKQDALQELASINVMDEVYFGSSEQALNCIRRAGELGGMLTLINEITIEFGGAPTGATSHNE